MNNVLETNDQLLGYGELMISAHEATEMIFTVQPDWLRRRQYLIEHQDRVIAEHLIEALKRGWVASNFDRQMWSDLSLKEWTSMPTWVRDQYYIYRPGGKFAGLGYHIVASVLIHRDDPFAAVR